MHTLVGGGGPAGGGGGLRRCRKVERIFSEDDGSAEQSLRHQADRATAQWPADPKGMEEVVFCPKPPFIHSFIHSRHHIDWVPRMSQTWTRKWKKPQGTGQENTFWPQSRKGVRQETSEKRWAKLSAAVKCMQQSKGSDTTSGKFIISFLCVVGSSSGNTKNNAATVNPFIQCLLHSRHSPNVSFSHPQNSVRRVCYPCFTDEEPRLREC